jgi:diamine N-acetyltransferase
MISKNNISLRALELSDLDLLYKWENNIDLWFLSNTLVPFSRYTLEQFILNSNNDIFMDKQLRLMIDLNSENNVITIGSIDLFDFDPKNKRAGIGILIDGSVQGKGYAGKALDLLIEYSFNTLSLHQLFCNITEGNEKSLNLFQGRGFEITGNKKDWINNNGAWLNEFTLQLIK